MYSPAAAIATGMGLCVPLWQVARDTITTAPRMRWRELRLPTPTTPSANIPAKVYHIVLSRLEQPHRGNKYDADIIRRKCFPARPDIYISFQSVIRTGLRPHERGVYTTRRKYSPATAVSGFGPCEVFTSPPMPVSETEMEMHNSWCSIN